MIDDKEREALIEYRIQQAFETIELARFLVSSDKRTTAVNRIYYGMYYALTALAIRNKFETSKHAQLIGWFNKEFIATKTLDAKFGKILRNAFQNRTKGDYDAYVIFSKNEVETLFSEMIIFIEAISQLLK